MSNTKCMYCQQHKKDCSLAPSVPKGRPAGEESTSSLPAPQKAVKREESSSSRPAPKKAVKFKPTFEIVFETKRKATAPPVDHPPQKRTRNASAAASSSRQPLQPRLSSPPHQNNAPPVDHPPQKHTRKASAAASSSGQPLPPSPSSPPPQNSNDFDAALRILAILRDAFAAADAEVRRQMARGADAPSLQDLLTGLFRNTKPDTKGKGKER